MQVGPNLERDDAIRAYVLKAENIDYKSRTAEERMFQSEETAFKIEKAIIEHPSHTFENIVATYINQDILNEIQELTRE